MRMTCLVIVAACACIEQPPGGDDPMNEGGEGEGETEGEGDGPGAVSAPHGCVWPDAGAASPRGDTDPEASTFFDAGPHPCDVDAGPIGACDGPVCVEDLARVAACTEIDGDVYFIADADPGPISLPSLVRIRGNLEVRRAGISSLDLPALTTIDEDVYVTFTSLTDLNGLSSLRTTGGIMLWGNAQLANVAGLANVDSMCGVHVQENHALVDLGGLEGVTDLAGDACPFPRGPNGIIVVDNDALTSLGAFADVERVYMIRVEGNDALASLDGLERVGEVTNSYVGVKQQRLVTTLVPLASAAAALSSSPYGSITIDDDDALVDLAGLEGVTALASLAIIGNDSLTSIDGLANLATVEDLVAVRRNTTLSRCTVDELVARIEAAGFAGNTEIDGNSCVCE